MAISRGRNENERKQSNLHVIVYSITCFIPVRMRRWQFIRFVRFANGYARCFTDRCVGLGFDAVNVTVSKVRVHQSADATENDSGWSEITLNPARKINLLNLTNGVLDDLGQTSLPAGHYTQLRLVLSANTGTTIANSVVLSGTTTEIQLVTPSAVQSGIKLINEFDVGAGEHVDLVLDFDASKSVIKRGNGTYALKPVIRIIPVTLNGIGGFIDPSLSGGNVLVTAQLNGEVVRSTSPNALTGEFFLARLATGNYEVVFTADGRTTAVIAGVPISSSTSTAQVSTVASPITLPTSTTGNITGNGDLESNKHHRGPLRYSEANPWKRADRNGEVAGC